MFRCSSCTLNKTRKIHSDEVLISLLSLTPFVTGFVGFRREDLKIVGKMFFKFAFRCILNCTVLPYTLFSEKTQPELLSFGERAKRTKFVSM